MGARTRNLLRQVEKLERGELDPQRIGAAIWRAHETGEMPDDPAMAAAVRPWLEAVEAIERVQEGTPVDEWQS